MPAPAWQDPAWQHPAAQAAAAAPGATPAQTPLALNPNPSTLGGGFLGPGNTMNDPTRMGGWTITDRATWFLSSMAEVLLRTRQQATRTTGEFTGSLQEYAKIRLLDA